MTIQLLETKEASGFISRREMWSVAGIDLCAAFDEDRCSITLQTKQGSPLTVKRIVEIALDNKIDCDLTTGIDSCFAEISTDDLQSLLQAIDLSIG